MISEMLDERSLKEINPNRCFLQDDCPFSKTLVDGSESVGWNKHWSLLCILGNDSSFLFPPDLSVESAPRCNAGRFSSQSFPRLYFSHCLFSLCIQKVELALGERNNSLQNMIRNVHWVYTVNLEKNLFLPQHKRSKVLKNKDHLNINLYLRRFYHII